MKTTLSSKRLRAPKAIKSKRILPQKPSVFLAPTDLPSTPVGEGAALRNDGVIVREHTAP